MYVREDKNFSVVCWNGMKTFICTVHSFLFLFCVYIFLAEKDSNGLLTNLHLGAFSLVTCEKECDKKHSQLKYMARLEVYNEYMARLYWEQWKEAATISHKIYLWQCMLTWVVVLPELTILFVVLFPSRYLKNLD